MQKLLNSLAEVTTWEASCWHLFAPIEAEDTAWSSGNHSGRDMSGGPSSKHRLHSLVSNEQRLPQLWSIADPNTNRWSPCQTTNHPSPDRSRKFHRRRLDLLPSPLSNWSYHQLHQRPAPFTAPSSPISKPLYRTYRICSVTPHRIRFVGIPVLFRRSSFVNGRLLHPP